MCHTSGIVYLVHYVLHMPLQSYMCKTTEALAISAAKCCRMGCTAFLGMVLYSNEATNSVTYDQTDTTVANKKLILFDQTLTSEYDALSDNNSPYSIGNRLDVAKD